MRRIGISLGNIGSLQDGLGEFALQVGQRIAARASTWRDQYGIALDFHLRDKFCGLFGDEVGYLSVNRLQRVRHVQPVPYAIWHSLHQLNKNLPPTWGGRSPGAHVVTVHDLGYRYGCSTFSAWRQQRRMLSMLRRTEQVVAISRYTADDVRQHLGWTGPLTVILNGARSFVQTPTTPLAGRVESVSRPFLFHLSRMAPSKNPKSIIDLARSWPEMNFVLCGPPTNEAQELRATVKLPNLQFHFGISDEQKAWAYANCAGFLFPSLNEGFGLPPIEAMHFGKPVFLARRTCLPEIGGAAAFYFDDFDPASMRAVVERGLEIHLNSGRADLVRVHAEQFNWDRAAEEYLDLYLKLLATKPISGCQ